MVGRNFFLEPNKEGLIYINDSWGGPCLFVKLTKGGPGELKYKYAYGDSSPPPPLPLPPKKWMLAKSSSKDNDWPKLALSCPNKKWVIAFWKHSTFDWSKIPLDGYLLSDNSLAFLLSPAFVQYCKVYSMSYQLCFNHTFLFNICLAQPCQCWNTANKSREITLSTYLLFRIIGIKYYM